MSSEDLSSSPSSLTALIQDPISNPNPNSTNSSKLKRSLRGTPDPDAEVVALSPRTLMVKNRFVCEICNKGFQRDQNLQLHRRGHNLPWKLKQRNKLEVVRKKVYICPEISCVHHDPTRALGDLTGVKKHYFRKHGEKKWKCEKCSKKYAVQSDWKAHSKICGTREYKCDCGTLFSRRDSFITHRAFCDALTVENSRLASFPIMSSTENLNVRQDGTQYIPRIVDGGGAMQSMGIFGGRMLETNNYNNNRTQYIPRITEMLGTNLGADMEKPRLPIWLDQNGSDSHFENPNMSSFLGPSSLNNSNVEMLPSETLMQFNSLYNNYTSSSTKPPPSPHMSATALLQKAAQMGSTSSTTDPIDHINRVGLMSTNLSNFDSSNNNDINDDKFMMMMMNVTQPNQIKGNGLNESHDSDFTRDFLGV